MGFSMGVPSYGSSGGYMVWVFLWGSSYGSSGGSILGVFL